MSPQTAAACEANQEYAAQRAAKNPVQVTKCRRVLRHAVIEGYVTPAELVADWPDLDESAKAEIRTLLLGAA